MFVVILYLSASNYAAINWRNEMTNLLTNAALIEFLATEGVMDSDDNSVYTDVVYTAEPIGNFKTKAAAWKGEANENLDGIEVTVLGQYQVKSGDKRKSLFYIDFKNDNQNIVLVY